MSLMYNNMPARVVREYIIERKGKSEMVFDLAYDHSRPFVIARGVLLNFDRTKVLI